MLQINFTSAAYILSAVAIFTLSAIVLFQNLEIISNRIFFLLCLAIIIWLSGIGLCLASTNPAQARFWCITYAFFGIIHIAPFLYLLTRYAYEQKFRVTIDVIVIYGLSLIAYVMANTTDLIIQGVQSTPWGYFPHYDSTGLAFILLFAGTLVAGGRYIYLATIHHRHLNKQLRLYSVAMLVGATGASEFITCFGYNLPPTAWASLLVFVLIMGYAKIRYGSVAFEPIFTYPVLFNALPNFILGIDAGDRIRMVNRHVIKYTGYEESELLGSPVTEILRDASKYFTLRDAEDPFVQEENSLRRFDDTYIPVKFAVAPVIVSGALLGHVFIAVDISEQLEMRKQLQHAQKMKTLGQLAGGIAHDFNNVLGTISGVCQLAEIKIKPLLPENTDFEKYLQLLKSSLERGISVTDRMATFVSGNEPNVQTISAMRHLLKIIELAKATLPKTIEVKVAPYSGYDLILADKSQLHQIVLNLCINAADAMPDGGRLTLGLFIPPDQMVKKLNSDTDRDYLCVFVSDTGVGIPDDIRDKIFDPFFTTKKSDKGAGLGLTTVEKIVQDHGGWIDFESELAQGTTFYVGLPMADGSITQEPYKDLADIPAGEGEKILLIEDEEALRFSLEQIFRSQGYDVVKAENGATALKLFHEMTSAPDLIFTDIGLPDIHGEKLVSEFQKTAPHLPIIATTGYVDPDLHARLKNRGIQHIMRKPINLKDALWNVAVLLGKVTE